MQTGARRAQVQELAGSKSTKSFTAFPLTTRGCCWAASELFHAVPGLSAEDSPPETKFAG